MNLYAYCDNNPVKYFDPSGYICDEKAAVYNEKMENRTLTKQEYKELDRYNRANNNPRNYQNTQKDGFKQHAEKEIANQPQKPNADVQGQQRVVGDNEQSVVYRTIRNDEIPENGLRAKNPDRGMSVEGHVVSGSRNKGSQYISTTTNVDVANKYASRDGCRVVKIDLNKLPDDVKIYDLSTETGRNANLKGNTAKNFACKSSEVLIEGEVPASAVSF